MPPPSSFVCTAEDDGCRIFHVLAARCDEISSAKLAKKVIKARRVRVNGEVCEATRRVRLHDTVEFELLSRTRSTEAAQLHSHTTAANKAAINRAAIRRQKGAEAFEDGLGNGLRLFRFIFPFSEGTNTDTRKKAEGQTLLLPPEGQRQAAEAPDEGIAEAVARGDCPPRVGEVRRRFGCSYAKARRAITAKKDHTTSIGAAEVN